MGARNNDIGGGSHEKDVNCIHFKPVYVFHQRRTRNISHATSNQVVGGSARPPSATG